MNTNEISNGALYVYGFTRAGLVPDAAAAAMAEAGVAAGLFGAGIDEPHPPFFWRSGRVAAVLSRVSQSQFCGPAGEKNLQDLAWLAPRACRHEAVLEQVMRLGAVLPARFGTLFSSTASLESFMRQHEAAIGRFSGARGRPGRMGGEGVLRPGARRGGMAGRPAFRAAMPAGFAARLGLLAGTKPAESRPGKRWTTGSLRCAAISWTS